MSLGGGKFSGHCDSLNPSLTAIIETLRAQGVAVGIASGNNGWNGSLSSPGCVSAAVTVGSTTKSDALSSFSNHEGAVDLLAPGSSIRSASASGNRRALIVKSSASMAMPHVTGAFVLLKSDKPAATVNQIERALACTGKRVSRNNLPRPRIDMFVALKYLRAAPVISCGWRTSS